MALSPVTLARIQRNIDEKKNGRGTVVSSSPTQSTLSIEDRVALNTALKRAGFTRNRENGLLNDSRYSNYQDIASSVNDDYINEFINDWDAHSVRMQTAYDGLNWRTAASKATDSLNSAGNDLLFRSAMIRYYLEKNKDQYEENWYNSFLSGLDSVQKYQRGMNKTFSDARKFYSQWETEDDYNAWVEWGKNAEAGLRRYQDDQKAGNQGEETFWEKIGRYLGVSADTTLPNAGMSQVSDSYRRDTTYREPTADWNDEQKKTFGYFYAQDPEKAFKFAEQLNSNINAAKKAEQAQKVTDDATSGGEGATKIADSILNFQNSGTIGDMSNLVDHAGKVGKGLMHSAGAILGNATGLADYLNDAAEYAARGRITEKTGDLTPFEYSQAVTGGISQHLNQKYGTLNEKIPVVGGKGLGDLYGLGMSVAQSAQAAYTLGPVGTLVQFFGSAAASGVDDAKSRGASDEQALWFGALSGVAEGAAEAFGVDKLLKIGASSTMREVMINVAKQGIAEGAEEGITSVLNNFADQLVMGDKSNFYILVQDYMNKGWSEAEAKKQSWLDMAEDLAYDALGGVVSGAVHAGPQTTYESVLQNRAYQNVYGENEVADLVQKGLKSKAGSLSHELAVKYQEKMVKGGTLTGAEINRLVKANEQSILAEDLDNIRNDAAELLTTLGEQENVMALADVIAKKVTKQKVTRQEQAMLDGSSFGIWILDELSMGTARAENIRPVTDRIGDNARDYRERSEMQKQGGFVTPARTQQNQPAKREMEVPQREIIAPVTQQTAPEPKATVRENRTTQDSLQVPAVSQQTQEADVEDGDGLFSVSKSGKPVQISTGKTVEIAKVARTDGNGNMLLELSDGTKAIATDIGYASRGEAMLYEAIAKLGAGAETSNQLIDVYRKEPGNVSVEDYTVGMLDAFDYGRHKIPQKELAWSETTRGLTEKQRNTAYNLGKYFGDELIQNAQANARRARVAALAQESRNRAKQEAAQLESGVIFDRKGRTFSEAQETGLKTMEQLSKLLGTKFHVFESYEKDGRRVYLDKDGIESDAPNGFFDAKTGELYIDLNAGKDAEGTVLFTVAHELTHFSRKWSPEKFDELARAVFELAYGQKDISVAELVRNQQNRAGHSNRELSFDEAYEEVVADSMEAILADGNVMQELMENVKQRDATLWEKIKEWFRTLAEDIRKMVDAYRGKTPDSYEGRAVAKLEGMLPSIEGFYTAALLDASENYKAAEGEKNTTQEDGKKYSYAGRIAQTANHSALEQAKQMQAQGEYNEQIRQKTGWYQGMDKKWRFEIDDSQMEIADNISNYMRLGDLLHHDPLFEAYPDMRDIDVVFQGLESGISGSYNPQFDSINLSYKLKNDPVGLKDALAHELQHAIQQREGFTKGATVESWEQKKKAGFDSRRAADIRKAQETERELRRIQEEEPEFYRDMVELDAMTPDLPRGEIDWETLEKIEDDPVEWQQYDARREELEAKYGDTKVWDMNDLLYQREQAVKNMGRSGVELYFDTAGEIEARDASNRRSKSSEQRKSSPPRLGNEDTVFAEEKDVSADYTEEDDAAESAVRFTDDEIRRIQSIGRKSINDFSSEDIRATEWFARQYWEEMGVKSPFFRAWFGDWRANDLTPVQVADEKGDARGVQHNDDTGWDINVSGKVFNETKAHRSMASRSAQQYLPWINDIIQKAVLLDSHGIGTGKAKSNNSLLMHSLYAVSDTGNGPEVLKLYVEEMNIPGSDRTAKRAYQLHNIEKAFGASVRVQGNTPSSLTNTPNTIKTVADLFDAVKRKDTLFVPNPESKVVNEDGTPMEMYHGTSNAVFTVFNTYGGNFGLFGKGSYFTNAPEVAQSYTRKGKGREPGVYGVYLNIKNPLDMDADADIAAWKQAFRTGDLDESYLEGIVSNEDAFRSLKECLADMEYTRWEAEDTVTDLIEGMGYDGITHVGGGRYGAKDGPRHRVYIAFEPEQIKSSSDNIGTYDGRTPDIRYSDRDPLQQKAADALKHENEKLKADVSRLKELVKLQGKITGGTMFTDSSVEASARKLIKDADAKGDAKELAGLLKDFYGYIVKGEELTWEGVQEATQPIVDYLLKNRKKYRSDYVQDILKDLRSRSISLSDIQQAEAARYQGTFNDYRKSLFGSVRITKDGLPLDEAWQELAELYPGVFDRDMNAADMPEALAGIVDRMKNSYEDTLAYGEDVLRQGLIRAVYDSYWNVSTLYTVADKKQKEINLLKAEHARKMQELKEDHKASVDELRKDYRDNQERVRENRNLRQQKKKARQKIRKRIMELDRLLNRGDKKKNVKDGMTAMVGKSLKLAEALFMDEYSNRDMLRNGVSTQMTDEEESTFKDAQQLMARIESGDVLDGMEFASELEAQDYLHKLDGQLSGKMAKLKDVFARERKHMYGTTVSDLLGQLADEYSRLSEAEDGAVRASMDENVYAHLLQLQKDVGGTTVRDMTLRQLEDVADAFTMVLTTVRNANKMFAQNLKFKRDVLAGMVMEEIRSSAKKEVLVRPGKDALDSFSWNNLKPVYAFERLGSDTMRKLYQNIRSGQDVWSRDMQEADEFRREQYKKHNRKAWDFEKQHSFDFASGKVDLSLEQIMSLYAYSRREAALDHLLKGGFVFSGNTEVVVKKNGIQHRYLKKDATAYNLTVEELAKVIDTLTKEQKAFVEEMQTYLSDVMGGKGNEVSLQMYGIRSFGEKNYFPLRSAGQYMEKAKEDSFRKEQGQISIVNSGFTKATTPHASNPITLDGFMDVWAEHVNDMSMYHGFVLPMEDFRRVYNYSTPNMEGSNSKGVNATIENTFGKAATAYIDQLYKDLNGGVKTDSTAGVINKGISMFKKGAVFASASVVVQQPSAIARAAALIDLKHFIGRKVDHKRHKLLWNEVKQYAPVAFVKEMGYFDTGMGRSAKDCLQAEEYSGIQEIAAAFFKDSDYRDEILGKAPAWADEVTWCCIWEAVKRETRERHPAMDAKSEPFLQLCGERFAEVIDKTQVYDSVLSRSANMRSKDTGMKMATAFMAEPTTAINMVSDALRKGKQGGKEGRRYCRKTIGAVVASQILNSFLVAWVYAARDDDEDEAYTEKYLSAFLSGILDGINPATYIPFVKDVVSIVQGYDVERSDMAVISDLWNAYQQLEKDGVSAWMKVEGFVGSICQIFGLPLKNIMRDVRAAYQAYNIAVNGEGTTKAGIDYAVREAFTGDSVSNAEQLYKARMDGDDAHAARVEARYDDEDSANAAVRAAIKDEFMSDKLNSETALKHMVLYSGMDASEAHWLLDAWEYRKATGSDDGYSKFNDFYNAVQTGKNLKSVIREYIDNGVKESTLSRMITEHFKPMYIDMSKAERANIKGYLINAFEQCGADREGAVDKVNDWDFEAQYRFPYSDIMEAYLDEKISASELVDISINYGKREDFAELRETYNTVAKPAGMSADRFYSYYFALNELEGERDDYGNLIKGHSTQDVRWEYINSLPIPIEQKDALHCAFYQANTLRKTPWHNN